MPVAKTRRTPKIGFVSLGCPKALVDSERILTQLRAEGYAVAPDYESADLVVVNHHLLFADFVLKEEGFGQILAGTDAIVIDEAHQLPELAAQFFGVRLSTRQLQELAKDVQTEADSLGDIPQVREAAEVLAVATTQMEAGFASGAFRQTLDEFLGREAARSGTERAGCRSPTISPTRRQWLPRRCR